MVAYIYVSPQKATFENFCNLPGKDFLLESVLTVISISSSNKLKESSLYDYPFNMDESGFPLDPKPLKTVHHSGDKILVSIFGILQNALWASKSRGNFLNSV